MSNRLKEILRFILTGGVCTVIEYAALYVLKAWLGWDVLIATPISFLISVFFNYLLCVKWVFSGAKEVPAPRSWALSSPAAWASSSTGASCGC